MSEPIETYIWTDEGMRLCVPPAYSDWCSYSDHLCRIAEIERLRKLVDNWNMESNAAKQGQS